jgi:uncharacterized protein
MDALNRHRERGRDDLAGLHALLDEVPYGTLATVGDGRPWQVPMLCTRDGDRLLLHGSTGAGALRHAEGGAPVSFCVMALDGLVLAHATFDHSANYRSAVLTGQLSRLRGDQAAAALDLISDRLVPGRTAEVRATLAKERAATTVLALPITEGSWLMKVRTGGPGDTDEVHGAWRGVVPTRMVHGRPEPASDSVDRPVPDSVRALLARDARDD